MNHQTSTTTDDLPRICVACGAENRPVARCCDQCGAELAQASASRTNEEKYADIIRPRVLASRVLSQAYIVSSRLMEHRARHTGVSVTQFRALWVVKLTPPPVTPGMLALHLAIDARTASDLIGRLEQGGWMRRVRDLPDRRATRLELTEEGDRILDRAWAPIIAALEDVWRPVPSTELAHLIEVLTCVRDAGLAQLGYSPTEIFRLGPISKAVADSADSSA